MYHTGLLEPTMKHGTEVYVVLCFSLDVLPSGLIPCNIRENTRLIV